MLKQFRKTLVTGIVVLVPLLVTIKVLELLFAFTDGILGRAVEKVLHKHVPGLGLILFLVLIYLTGLVYRTFFGRGVILWSEQVIDKIPLVRTIYSGIKQLMGPFGEDSQKTFGRAVLVRYPATDAYTYGFLVNENVMRKDGADMVNVYLPFNHLHLGMVMLVDRKCLIEVDATFEEMVTLMASFGVAAPDLKSLATPKESSLR